MSFFSTLLVLISAAAPAAAADSHIGIDHNQIHGLRVDLHGSIDTVAMLGGGARFEFAIVPNGFIRGNVFDELALSFGADMLVAPTYLFTRNRYDYGYDYDYDGGSAYIAPIAAAQWNFYLGDRWSVFPEVGIAVPLRLDRDVWYDQNGRPHSWVSVVPDVGIGARYHFNPSVALLMRLSTPGGLQIGVVF